MRQGVTAFVKNKILSVIVEYPEETTEILLKLDSDRNHPLVRFSDVSSLQDEGRVSVIRQDYPGEIWFPVIDLEITPAMYGRAVFAGKEMTAEYVVNGWLWPERHEAAREAVIPSCRLLEWENGLFVTDRGMTVSEFAVWLPVPQPLTISRRGRQDIRLLGRTWSGTVTAYERIGKEYRLIGQAVVKRDGETRRSPETGEHGTKKTDETFPGRSALMESLKLNFRYILSSRIRSQNNPMAGGFYLFYDLDARTYRLPAWLWGWGPAIAALLAGEEIPEIREHFGEGHLLKAALLAGAATLRGEVFWEGSELDGLGTARWDPNPSMKSGYRQRVCGASDSGFLCGYAWVPLYEKTGEEAYLHASLRYAQTTGRLVERYGIPPQDYMPEEERWSAHTLDESGFGVKAFDRLYHLTGDPAYREIGRRYIDCHIEKFRRPDGLWERAYYRENDETEPSIFMTRGLGWAMEGLLSAWSLTGEQRYLDQAKEMAAALLEKQRDDGSWLFMLNQGERSVGVDEKGTPLWSLLLYRLYRACREDVYLSGARKALGWCVRNQIVDDREECVGGLAGANPQAAVVYRPWFSLSCLYSSGFFALALMEELSL